MSIRIEGADKLLAALRALPKELQQGGGNAVRNSVRKAANLVKDQVVQNLDAIIAQPNQDGREESTGFLRENIKVTRGKIPNGERFSVRISGKRYPGHDATAVQVGRQLEYGTEKREALPYMRPAFEQTKEAAAMLMVNELEKRIAAIWKRAG